MTTWSCPGTVVEVHDGDTIVADVDLGYHVRIRTAIRIDGLAAPELDRAGPGRAARDYLAGLLPPGAPITVVSTKLLGRFEKYGRVLAAVTFTPPTNGRPVEGDVAIAMIAAGHAVAWDGRGRQPA